MKTPPTGPQEPEWASTIHLDFIRNLADRHEDSSLADVESYHRALFMHRHGQDLERFRNLREWQEARLAYLTPRWEQVRHELAHAKPLASLPSVSGGNHPPTHPWNGWDIAMFATAFLGIVTLLVFGVFNISFNLLESGLITFMEHPVRAYFWAALLPVGALAVKIGWDVLPGPRWRHGYLWTSLTLGLVGVLVWVAAYATIYPTLSQSTEDQLASLQLYGDASGFPLAASPSWRAKGIDTAIVSAQAMAEIFLSAVLGMYMTMLYTKHRRIRIPAQPGFAEWDEERRRLELDITKARHDLAEAKGSEDRLLHQLTVFLASAKSLYEKEVNQRQDRGFRKRRLLEQITDDFKARLESVEKDPAFADDLESPRLALRSHSQS